MKKKKTWKNPSCQRHYEANKPAYFARAKAHDARMRAKTQAWLVEYLLLHPCVDCGIDDIIVLEFDHRDQSLKKFSIGESRSGRYSLKRVQDEVAKCDVRCANCHRRKTSLQFGWTSRRGPIPN